MSTVKVYLKTAYESKDKTYPIIIEVRHKGKKKHVYIDKVKKEVWDGSEVIKKKHADAELINSKISTELSRIKRIIAECSISEKAFDISLLDSAASVANGLAAYIGKREAQYKESGKVFMMAKASQLASDILACFQKDMSLTEWNKDKAQELNAWLIKKDNCANTRIRKFSLLNTFFKNLAEEENTPMPTPFAKMGIKREPVKKTKLTVTELKKLEEVVLPKKADMARDLFLLGYYCKGARFSNLMMMQRSQVREGRLEFVAVKGGKHISVLIHSKLQALIDKYAPAPFVIPYLKALPTGDDGLKKMVDRNNKKVNRWLAEACKAAGIKRVTMHEGRHTFAFHLKTKTNNIFTITQSLGQSSARITEMYLKDLDDTAVDQEVSKLYE